MIRGQHNQGTKKVVVPIGSTALLLPSTQTVRLALDRTCPGEVSLCPPRRSHNQAQRTGPARTRVAISTLSSSNSPKNLSFGRSHCILPVTHHFCHNPAPGSMREDSSVSRTAFTYKACSLSGLNSYGNVRYSWAVGLGGS